MHRVSLFLCILLISACAVAQADKPQPEVVVRTLTLGVSPTVVSLDEQQQIIQDIQSCKYASDKVDEFAERVQYGFQTLGFFKARAEAPAVKLVSQTPQQEIIDLAFSVDPGDRYRLNTITFTRQKAFTDAELRPQFPLAEGDIFNAERIRQGLDALRKFYESKGYVNFTPVPNTETDDAAHTISLMVDIDEGVQFRIGPLVLDGVETKPGAGAKLLADWKQYQGRIYDPAIPGKFLRDNAALLPGVNWVQNLAITQDQSTRVLVFRLDLPDPVDANP